MNKIILLLLFVFLFPSLTYCQGLDQWEGVSVRNAFSLLAQGNWDDSQNDAFFRLGWKPELELDFQPVTGMYIRGDVSMDNAVSLAFADSNDRQNIDLDVYRAWISAGTANTTLRGGLQHIQIGPAQIIRPLQWFDSLSAADMFAATKGVKALLLTHYFPDPNLRLWAIMPDNDLPANLLLPSEEGTPELGGRLEFHTKIGDSGISMHHRKLSANAMADKEFRFGIDHRMDTVIGLWTEASASLYEHPAPLLPRASASVTVGYDYTISAGNGIHLLMEHNLLSDTNGAVGNLRSRYFSSAMMASYPTGLLDTISLLGIWNWTESKGLATMAFRRVYDYLSWELGVTMVTDESTYPGAASGIHLKIALDL